MPLRICPGADRQSLPWRARLARSRRAIRRRAAGRVQPGGAWASSKAICGPARPSPPWACSSTRRRMSSSARPFQMIFGGQAGGWPAGFAANIGEMRGIEFVPIAFEVAGDLAHWQVEFRDALSGVPRPWAGRPRRRASGCRRSILRVPRSAPAGLPPGAVLSRSAPRGLASIGRVPAGRASTSRSTGPVPTLTGALGCPPVLLPPSLLAAARQEATRHTAQLAGFAHGAHRGRMAAHPL